MFRELLYFPLGMIPSVFFLLRMLTQWYQSEARKVSYVGSGFWKLSLAGNLTLFLHHFVQVQYPFAMIQGVNALISWRNLNLMKAEKPLSTKRVLLIGMGILLTITLLFLMQSYLLIGNLDWIRTPKKPWNSAREYHSLFWHLLGTAGGIIFASRFWVQWWRAERRKFSELDKIFWYLSIIGSALLLFYAIQIRDTIIFLYNVLALIPYFRNLLLMRKSSPPIK